jgi:hypothetical protein
MSELRMGLWPTHRDENRVEPEAMHALRPPRPILPHFPWPHHQPTANKKSSGKGHTLTVMVPCLSKRRM